MRHTCVRMVVLSVLAAAGLLAAGCGSATPGQSASGESGVEGRVLLGPTCPVATLDDPCEDRPAAGVEVRVSQMLPGELLAEGPEVARTTTEADGSFRVVVAPGEYVVTATAGMSCELLDARVVGSTYTRVEVPCDTGIR